MKRINPFMNLPEPKEAHKAFGDVYKENKTGSDVYQGINRIQTLGEAASAAYNGLKTCAKAACGATAGYFSHGKEAHVELGHSFEAHTPMNTWNPEGPTRPICELSDVVNTLGTEESIPVMLEGKSVVYGFPIKCDGDKVYVADRDPTEAPITLTSVMHRTPAQLSGAPKVKAYPIKAFDDYQPLALQK